MMSTETNEPATRSEPIRSRQEALVRALRNASYEVLPFKKTETAVLEHVPLDELEVRVLRERRPAQRVAVEVVQGDDLVLVDEAASERRADEPRAAGDDDPLSAQRHAASLVAAPRTRDDGRHRRGTLRGMRGIVGLALATAALAACATGSAGSITSTASRMRSAPRRKSSRA